jgi:hypothetical protein
MMEFLRLGEPFLDEYLRFVAARCRPNTLLAQSFDLKVFFGVVGKPPLEVLATSPLAGSAELDMLAALNDNAALDRYSEAVDAEAELVDDGEDEEGQR